MEGAINILGFLFYFLVFIAAITSSISLMEVSISLVTDKRMDMGLKPNRTGIVLICSLLLMIVGLPVMLDALGSGNATIKAPYELLGLTGESVRMWNDCWLDLYDMLSEGILMPLGALIMSILIVWVFGPKLIKDECESHGNSYSAGKFFGICFKFIVPIVMVIVPFAQIQDFFF